MGQAQVIQQPTYLVVIYFEEDDFEATLHALTISELYRASHKHMKHDMSLTFKEFESEMDLNTDKDLKIVWKSKDHWQKTLHIKAIQDGNVFDVKYEQKLRRMMIGDIFKLKKSRRGWTVGASDDTKGIKSYYKTNQVTQCYLFATMPFRATRNIFDYFLYLQCGYNNDSLWDKQVAGETVQYFDENHQLMYSNGDAGAILNMFIQPRDLYYMQTRFIVNENGYKMIGSLMYSIDKTHPYYYKKENDEYMRARIKYRGFVLLQAENTDKTRSIETRLIYISRFDVKGGIPHVVVKQQLKSKAVQLLQHFDASWNDKVHCLKVRRKKKKKKNKISGYALKSWFNRIGRPQYYDRFVEYGFCHLYYLRFITKSYLKKMEIAPDDTQYLITEIEKLTLVEFSRRLVMGFLLNIQLSFPQSNVIVKEILECCFAFYCKDWKKILNEQIVKFMDEKPTYNFHMQNSRESSFKNVISAHI